MNVNPKSTKENAPGVPTGKPDVPEVFPVAFADLFHKGVERLVNLQKATLDAIHQQAVDTNQVYRQAFKSAPGAAFFDVADEWFAGFTEARKSYLDLVIEQSGQMAEMVKERPTSVSGANAAAKEFFNDSADRVVTSQRIALDFAAQQNKNVIDAVKKQPGVPGTPVATAADSVRKGVDDLLAMQKELLDVAVRPLKTAPAAKV